MNKINYGIIGDGEAAFRHAHAISLDPHASLLSLSSPDRNSGEELSRIHSIPFLERDPEYMLEREDIDAVVIVLGVEEHMKYIEYALRYSKIVVVDAPLTISHDDAERIISLTEDGYFIFNSNCYLYLSIPEGGEYTLTFSSLSSTPPEMLETALETVIYHFGKVSNASMRGQEIYLLHRNRSRGRIILMNDSSSLGMTLSVDGNDVFTGVMPYDGLGNFYSYVYTILRDGGEIENKLFCSLEASRIITKLVP